MFGRSEDGEAGVGGARTSLSHRHTWVKGPDYVDMEDNDLRGFLDGRYVAAWNQPHQNHVRLGRKPGAWAKTGDRELFRVLQRWGGIWLPAGSRVTSARLMIDVEQGADRELEVLLYEVHKDWKPGEGGVLRNNNSAPSDGEVWWNEVGRGMESWGLPGAGFASDTHPNADTPVAPLALGRCQPGDSSIVFESDELATYVERRVMQGKPLLFLLKLTDYLEDIPGTSIDVYSCNHGDDRNTARRPRLDLEWVGSLETAAHERNVLLEHGRTITLPRLEGRRPGGIAVSFEAQNQSERPTISIRGGNGTASTDWRPIDYPEALDWTWLEVRLDAYVNPLPLGEAFTAELRDTWVTTGPREEQEVLWTFTSPSGIENTVLATYAGDSRWRVRFVPEEIGRWQYQWSQNFTDTPYESAIGAFDVIPGDRENALQALDELIERANASDQPPGRQRGSTFSVAFNRLQRGLMRHETPESFPLSDSQKDGGETGLRLDDARLVLGGTRPQHPRLAIDYPEGVTLQ